MLLLGAGEAGKSTVVKQVKLIHKGQISQAEKDDYVAAIRSNCVECMSTLLEAMTNLGISLEGDEKAEAARNRVLDAMSLNKLTPELAQDISLLWNDAGVKATYDQRDKFWLLDASQYYFEEVLRLAEEDFEPTEEDMIMTRIRTTGIVVTEFTDGAQTYSLVDVGGQRSERRKWIHCFDDSKAIIFLVGLSGYNQVLFEDSNVIRMHESLELFDQIVNNPIFRDTPIFVFLNKKDLFEQVNTQHRLGRVVTSPIT
jgi:GTPase SAR1 family protein